MYGRVTHYSLPGRAAQAKPCHHLIKSWERRCCVSSPQPGRASSDHRRTHVVRQWAPSPQPRWGAGLRRVVPSWRRPSARENVRALNANVRQQRMQLIDKLLGLAAAGQDHSSRVRGRARRRGLMWRSVAEPLPSRGRTSQPFLRRGACGDPTVFSERSPSP